MKDLFLSELRRFRWYAAAAAVAHLLLLQLMNRSSDLLQQSYFESAPLLIGYSLIGLSLALVQVGAYRKPSQWLWLLHRPLPPTRIFFAMAAAGLTLLALVILLPQLVLLLATDLFGSRVVDLRHYLWLPHVLALASMAWLAGTHAVLARSKAAIAVLAVPPLFAVQLLSVWWLLLPMALCLAWLGFIAARSFRPDRETPPTGTLALALTALPLQLGLFLLVFEITQFGYVTGGMLLGTDPLNTEYPPEGGLVEAQRMDPAKLIARGLESSRDPRAESWRDQLPLLEPVGIGAWLGRFPLRHQFGNLQVSTQWYDEERSILWTFSHDRMLFLGRNPRSGVAQGEFGLGGIGDATPFPEVPIAHEERYLLTRSALYAIDFEQQRLHELLRLPAGEWFTGLPATAEQRLLLLSNRGLGAWRQPRDAADAFAPLQLDWQLPLPQGPDHLEGVHMARLMDGWLLSFLYGDGHRQIGFIQFAALAQPRQRVWFVDDSGAVEVGDRVVARDYPALHQTAWWLSPALHLLADWPDSLVDRGLTWPLRPVLWPRDLSLQILAAVLLLGSLLTGRWWLRGNRMPASRRRLWLASCALLGVPGLLSLMCLEPRAPRE
ncbi:MAG TPA: hypothetical protein VFY12_03350 [Arenimonas sp.]|nr:hypothetical protein [Arenimonas sp.]